ncbi:hypothetical protein Poli38472_009643 [Pythium oligandrum]|uniref:DM10 domain-containing protein n=1 Tax=Pythium oligandrum TaxID=41045 RepID=A0A8K1CG61_PYTOL|nr:hypothetical protein Poli38472_009643 [Pythium oligandrum]|eukprot:TMW62150.1 hypothetical protein Poli38472_009643 [Pythium oligandrum]
MPTTASLEKQKEVPMIFRRHGDTNPKTRGHALGDYKPASSYVRELQRQGLDTLTTLENNAAALTISKPFCPQFIANDKKVLRFGAYFLEAVHESNMENYRVRKCEVFYYLEDDTLQITEPKIENSGILQGNFVKRHRIPKPESDVYGNMQHFTFRDMNIGKEVTCYGRTFHLITADAFTRQYLASQRIHVPADEEPPRDTYTEARKLHMSRETGMDPDAKYGKKQYPMKEFMEARLGKFARPSDFLKRFLDHDRHVLRFFAIWDDTDKLYGMKHRYTIHYFLADNTIEILESYERNSGCDPFPKLLNRTKLSRDPAKQVKAAVCDNETEESLAITSLNFYSWQDFQIGKYIPIHNRQILILDADATTREWFDVNGSPLGSAIVLKDDPKRIPPFIPPAHDGFGSEEDSLQSCYHLLPKAPLKSIESLDTTEVLRFRARFDTNKPEDIDRRFIIMVIVSDASVQIMEPVQRNAGIVGGKFLERTRVKNANGSGAYLGLNDFYVGSRVQISGRIFIIYEMDDYSANYMEAHAAKFIRSHKIAVVQKVRSALLDKATLNTKLAAARKGGASSVDPEELTSLFDGLVPDFAPHDAMTIIRNFGDKQRMTIQLDRVLELAG